MRKMMLILIVAFVAASLSGCAYIAPLISNTAAQDTAATVGGEGATYIALTALQYENPAIVVQTATDIKDIAATIGGLATGTLNTSGAVLTFQDFGVSVALIPANYQFLAQAILALIPASINVPTNAIPAQYLTLISDFCTAAGTEAATFIPASAKLKVAAANPVLDPLHNFVNTKTGA
jgi:hypothetical protein